MNTNTPLYLNDAIPSPNNTSPLSFPSGQNYGNRSFTNTSNTPIRIMNPDKSPADGEFSIGGGAKGNMVPLPLDFIPGNFDVLCGRGKKNYNSLGNQRLRRIVESYVEQYSAATSRQDKSDILSAIVNEVRSASPNGGFIKQDPVTERWFEVGDFLAREKVSQAFRDALSFQYRSSKKFKHEKRRQRDKAAKLAKQKGLAKSGDEKKAPPKSPPADEGRPLLKKKQSLTVLREEPSMASTFMAQGSAQPNRPSPSRSMSSGNATPPDSSFLQGRQAYGGAEQLQQQGGGSQFFSFNNAAAMHQEHQGTMVGRHSSWPGPQMFPSSNNPLFNPLHAGAHQSMAAMSQRRFSDARMSDVNQSPFHQFHQSEPHPMTWSRQLHHQEQNSGALHSSYSSGMGIHPGVTMSAGGMPGSMMSTSGMPPLGNHQMANSTMSHSGSKRSRKEEALRRSNSNVSTNSETAIVARLESSLTNLEQDENPFEPVPLPSGQLEIEPDEEARAENRDETMPGW